MQTNKVFNLSHQHYLQVRSKLKPAQLDVYLYLATKFGALDKEIQINTKDLAIELGYNLRTVQIALKKLNQLGLIKSDLVKNSYIEASVRSCLLFREFSDGMTEVSCPAGRIDLLTHDQIIEVKRITDWKSALGQILVYSAYYPEHQKRIHLFGSEADREKLLDIELSCSAFDVLVTFEAIGGQDNA